MITPREMLIQHLKGIGADGLCNPHDDCGCSLADLAPCQCINLDDCLPAHKVQDRFVLLVGCKEFCLRQIAAWDLACLWEAYQQDQSHENCCRWLKHRAWARSESCP